MLWHLTKRIACFIWNRRIVIHEREGCIPNLFCLFFCLPDIPCIRCISENCNFTWLWLLHWIQHNSLNLRWFHSRMKECIISTHDQVFLWVICTRPINPHKWSTTYIVCKCRSKVIRHFSPDSSSSHNNLYVVRCLFQNLKFLTASVAHIVIWNIWNCHLHIRIFFFHFFEPICHIIQQA